MLTIRTEYLNESIIGGDYPEFIRMATSHNEMSVIFDGVKYHFKIGDMLRLFTTYKDPYYTDLREIKIKSIYFYPMGGFEINSFSYVQDGFEQDCTLFESEVIEIINCTK